MCVGKHTCARPNNMLTVHGKKNIYTITTGTHTRSEFHRSPWMARMGVVGQCNMEGHARKALECPQGPGRRYVSRVANSKKTQTKKKSNKPARKNTSKGKQSGTKSRSHGYCLALANRQKKKSRVERGRNARNQLKQRGHKTQATQAAKTVTLYYCLKKNQRAGKTQSKSRNSCQLHMQCLNGR